LNGNMDCIFPQKYYLATNLGTTTTTTHQHSEGGGGGWGVGVSMVIPAPSFFLFFYSSRLNTIFGGDGSILFLVQSRRRPNSNYMQLTQQDITPDMRAILVDWLVEVAQEYQLVSDTFFLTINYIDRFLSREPVMRSKLQLVGVSCMLIASKYEEIYAPQVDEFCFITDNTYAREEVLEMETRVLNTLGFELTTPTTKTFLRRYLKVARADPNLEYLSSYIAETSQLSYQLVGVDASKIAAAIVLLAQWVITHHRTVHAPGTFWDSTLFHYTGYHSADLKEICSLLFDIYRAVTLQDYIGQTRTQLPAIREKYSTARFREVSRISPPTELPDQLFHRNPSASNPFRRYFHELPQ